MIPREILKKIRQIEMRTNRLVTETLGGPVPSVFKGQGMNFDEVREYQPGDEVRSIDWNVTARMNHPFIKKFVEERELTLMLRGGRERLGLVRLARAIQARTGRRDRLRAGLLRHPQQRQGRPDPVHATRSRSSSRRAKAAAMCLRVIREVLFFEPRRRGTDLNGALEFLLRVTPHQAIAVVISDFIGSPADRAARRGAGRGRK